MKKLKKGQLVAIKEDGLEISGGEGKPNIPVKLGSILMVLGETTYAGALKEAGYDYSMLPDEERHHPEDEPFMTFLFSEEIVQLPISDVNDFFEEIKREEEK